MILVVFRVLVLGSLLAWLSPRAMVAQESTGSPTPEALLPAEVSQPAYEVLRVDDNGTGRSYRVWEEWVPQVVTTPDGGAWSFFTAQIRGQEGNADRRLFASRFDPELRVWLPARALGANATQFGATAAADSQGIVHLIYSSRAGDGAEAWSQLVYQRFQNGAWTDPVPVAPHPDAGHQMLASLAVDKRDGLHVVWRDQRFVSPEARAALATNADILMSDLVEGEWTEPAMINIREAPDINPPGPPLVPDGDRLVVVWSIYRGTTAEEMRSAVRVDWSSRPLDASSGWSSPQTLYVREGGDAGGRLIDLASDPRGGAVIVYGLFNRGNNDLMLQRLDAGKDAWTAPVLIASGDFGYLPAVTIAGDGTIYAVFNNGRNRDVDIGGLTADASGESAGAVTLTPAEGGITARASISIDSNGVPWVIYMHQPDGSTNVTEIQSVRAATFV